MARLRWYLKRSTINTNKKEAQRIGKKLRKGKRYKNVRVVPRTLRADKKTKTSRSRGYWVKVRK